MWSTLGGNVAWNAIMNDASPPFVCCTATGSWDKIVVYPRSTLLVGLLRGLPFITFPYEGGGQEEQTREYILYQICRPLQIRKEWILEERDVIYGSLIAKLFAVHWKGGGDKLRAMWHRQTIWNRLRGQLHAKTPSWLPHSSLAFSILEYKFMQASWQSEWC